MHNNYNNNSVASEVHGSGSLMLDRKDDYFRPEQQSPSSSIFMIIIFMFLHFIPTELNIQQLHQNLLILFSPASSPSFCAEA